MEETAVQYARALASFKKIPSSFCECYNLSKEILLLIWVKLPDKLFLPQHMLKIPLPFTVEG